MQHSEIPGVRGAFVGVDVFFVLSGFLITTLLYEEAQATGQISVARFLRNRAIRLMPPLLMFLAAAIAIGPYFWPNDNFPLISLITALYLTDYVNTFLGELSIAMHTWSLAVEQHYYLIWPMIVLSLCKVSADQRIRFLIVAFILLTLWRISNAWFLSDWALTAYRFDTRASGLVIGSALALTTVAITKKAANILGLFSLVALCCLALTLDGRPFLVACAQPVIDLAAAGLIVSIIGRNQRLLVAFFHGSQSCIAA